MQKILPITRNLLIINVLCYLLQVVLEARGIDITQWLGLHFVLADQFNVFQLFTYMFLHGSLTHLFFNMFSLWMFGSLIERQLGTKRFLFYYAVCGIGAALCQELWQTAEYYIEGLQNYELVNTGSALIPMAQFLNHWTTIGASGACYGILLAFGMFFPNERIMLLIPPIPMKAKYFVVGYAVIEVLSAYFSNDNVAHFAHLGGMLLGLLLLLWWRKKAKSSPRFNGWEEWEPAKKAKTSFWQRTKAKMQKKPAVGNAHHTATRQSDYEENMRSRQDEARMDEILDKVRRSGYDSLSKDEKQELFRLSRR